VPEPLAIRFLREPLISLIGQKVDHKKAEKVAKKMAKGQFDLEDMRDQLLQMEQMGGIEALMDKMPGMGQIPQSVKNQMMGAVESKGWNGSSASTFSPTPKNLIGLPVIWRTESAAPPRASPSVLVKNA
jgi:hypothetical protein